MGLNPPIDRKEQTTRQYMAKGDEATRTSSSLEPAGSICSKRPSRSPARVSFLRENMDYTASSGREWKQKKSLRVRFDENPKIIYGAVLRLDDYTIEELSNCWWDERESEGTRLNAKYLSSQAKKTFLISKIESSFKQTLLMTGGVNLPDSRFVPEPAQLHQKKIEEERQTTGALHHLSSPPRHIVVHLVKWSATAHSVRGLERWASPTHNKLRFELAKAVRGMILHMQTVNGYSEEDVALHYAKIGLTSVLFARFLGYADGLAAGNIPCGDCFASVDRNPQESPETDEWVRGGNSQSALGTKLSVAVVSRTNSRYFPPPREGNIMLSSLVTTDVSASERLA